MPRFVGSVMSQNSHPRDGADHRGNFHSRFYDTSDSRDWVSRPRAISLFARPESTRWLAATSQGIAFLRWELNSRSRSLCDQQVASSFVVLVAWNATTLHAETKNISRLDVRRRDGHDLFGAAAGFSRIKICQPAKFLIVKDKSRLLRSWTRVSGWTSMAMLCTDTRGLASDAASWPRILCKTRFWQRSNRASHFEMSRPCAPG